MAATSTKSFFFTGQMIYPERWLSEAALIMEMVYGGIASMLLGWWVGRAFKLSDVGTIVVLTMAGGGSLLTGLAYLWMADIIVGQSGSLMWFVVGAIGGIMGIVAYFITTYADWFVQFCKDNGIL